MSTSEHKKNTPGHLKVAILIVSTTRTPATDKSGEWMEKQAGREGHAVVAREIVPDDAIQIAEAVTRIMAERAPHLMIVSGGTGLAEKDVTIEAVSPMFRKELSAFGPIFAQLSYEDIFSAAIMSRATAGLIGQTAVFCIPGSLNACKLACKELIFPEAGHIARHIQTN